MHGAFVLLFVLHASAYRWDTKTFTYIGNLGQAAITYRRSGNNECRVCFAEKDCLPFSPVECEYYIETNKILQKENEPGVTNTEDPEIRASLDSLVYSMIEQGKSEADMAECLPYISKYSDCTKENICLGCKTCDCDSKGRWNCTMEQTCRPDLLRIVADQRTLATVIETLNMEPIRRKRSLYHSVRSLEDTASDIDDNYNDKQRFTVYHTTPIDEDPEDTNALFEDRPNVDETESTTKVHKNKGLIKLIVHSLIHDTLPGIFEANNLDFESNRVKRWISSNKTKENLINMDTTSQSILELTDLDENDVSTPKNKITFEELSEWVNGVHPFINADKLNNTLHTETNYDSTTTEVIGIPTVPNTPARMTISNAEYVAFEEVYSNMQVDNKTYVRRKPPLDHIGAKYTEKEFNMYDDKYYGDTLSSSTLDNLPVYNIFEEAVTPLYGKTIPSENDVTDNNYQQQPTEIVFNLFEAANMVDLQNDTGNPELNNNKIDDTDKLDVSAVNVMKRDVSSSSTTKQKEFNLTNLNNSDSVSINSTKIKTNTTGYVNYLKNGVLDPLDAMLENKQKEMKEILQMREHLVKFIQAHREHSNVNISSKDLSLKLYKLEYIPHYHRETPNLKGGNLTMNERYTYKLKRDVYEVIRDVLALKHLHNNTTKFPSELNFLIRSLKHYIHKTGFHPKSNISPHSRRNNIGSNNNIVKNHIIKILQFLIKTNRYTDALTPASLHSKRLIRRIIKKNYVDDFAGTGLRIYDTHYNLTNDLRNVGTQWHILTSTIDSSPAADKLHNVKRLHLLMSADIAKLNDALALIDFARGRRMVPVDESGGENVVMNINKKLEKIKDKIENLKINNGTGVHKKKDSFMSQIKRLLTNSKRDILKLLRRNVPKSDIVKQIAKKNVEEITQKKLQDTMERWQTDLNIISRNKRSIKDYDKMNRRIKNIIPKYLRGKVHPAMAKGSKSKKSTGNNKNITMDHKKKTLKPKSHKGVKVTTVHPRPKTSTKRALKHSKKHSKLRASTKTTIAHKIAHKKTRIAKTKSTAKS